MMEPYLSAKKRRENEWKRFTDMYDEAKKRLEDRAERLEEEHAEILARRSALAELNRVRDGDPFSGGAEVYEDEESMEVNAGGEIVRVSRDTLTHVEGSPLEILFGGRWERRLLRDDEGRPFLDVDPTCFRRVVDLLHEYRISPPDDPPDLPVPAVPREQRRDQDVVAAALLGRAASLRARTRAATAGPLDSVILTTPERVEPLRRFLIEEGVRPTRLRSLYRGSRDGADAGSFHRHCDDKGATVTVVETTCGHVFGGYADVPWGTNDAEDDVENFDGFWVPSDRAFLFGLECREGGPFKSRINHPNYALYHDHDQGPTFSKNDLVLLAPDNRSCLEDYETPPGRSEYCFTGKPSFDLKEIEVFRVDEPDEDEEGNGDEDGDEFLLALPTPVLVSCDLPQPIRARLEEEGRVLDEIAERAERTRRALDREETVVDVLCGPDDDDDEGRVVRLHVGGRDVAVSKPTLARWPDSVLYKRHADPEWRQRRWCRRPRSSSDDRPRDWDADRVVAWVRGLEGLSAADDVSRRFRDVTGAELAAMTREDLKDLLSDVDRPAAVALLVERVRRLRDEDDDENETNRKSSAPTLVEHDAYCFGKILNHMRAESMSRLPLVPPPEPPEIDPLYRKRFRRIVEYYFPTKESSAAFLGTESPSRRRSSSTTRSASARFSTTCAPSR